MQSTKQQLLRNPNIQPADDVIAESLGEANDAYVQFFNELELHDIQIEWRYYSDGKAWLAKGLHRWVGARGGKKEMTVFWLSIWDGFFKITIYIPKKAREVLLALPVDNEVKRMIDDSAQMGKLKFFPIVFELNSDDKFETLYTVIDFKKSVK